MKEFLRQVCDGKMSYGLALVPYCNQIGYVIIMELKPFNCRVYGVI